MDLFAPRAATVLVLLCVRCGVLLAVAPLFSSRAVPAMLRLSLGMALGWLLLPAAAAGAGAGVGLTPAAAVGEVVIGFGLGLGAALMVLGAELAGELLAVHTGLSGAAALDPLTNQSTPVLGQLTSLFAVTALFSLDAHLELLRALAASLRLLPVGGALHLQAGAGTLLALVGQLFVLGIRFAAPVVAVVLLANVALAVLTRVAPQLNVLAVAFPAQIGLGLLALAASVPLLATHFGDWGAGLARFLDDFGGALRVARP